MTAEVEMHPDIEEWIHVDAEGSDEKQISDIQDMVAGGNCHILLVRPNEPGDIPLPEDAGA